MIDADDAEARRITEALANERARVLECPPAAGNLNPKTCKLHKGLADVETPLFAVLDDDTLLADRNLEKAIFALKTCDLYTGLPCYLPGENLWSSLVAHFVNNNSILTYLPLLPLVGPVSLNGMFYALRTDTLKRFGGFGLILDQLCDDYALARLVRSHRGTIRQGITPQRLRTTVGGSTHYFRLMHRWFVFANVLAGDQPPAVLFVIFFFLGLPPILLWLGLLILSGGFAGILVLFTTLLLRHLALQSLHRSVLGDLPGFSWNISILAELLQPLHWLHAVCQHTIRWRTRRIRVGRDGTFTYLNREGP